MTAGVVLTTMLGSIHAFSVFLDPLETSLGISRARASFVYSGALIFLTLAVLVGHRLYGRYRPALLALIAALGAAIGLVVSGLASNYWLVFVGYSVIFGLANGLGYGFALQFSAQALPHRRGFAMGLVTAFYAFGAASAPVLFSRGLNAFGFRSTMILTAAVFVVLGFVAAVLLTRSAFRFQGAPVNVSVGEAGAKVGTATTARLWLGYGAGALSGLMVIGHAAAIIEAVGGSAALAVGATAAMAIGNMVGGLGAGALADRVPIRHLLVGLPALSTAFVLTASAIDRPALLAPLLVGIGLTYGAIIAVYPVAVLTMAGPEQSSALYGRVFTSWGVAGLAGPWLAGRLFDTTGDYSLALMVAAAIGIVSAATTALGRTTPTR